MEILLDNSLASMYGPYFLVLFGFIIFFTVILLAIVKSQFDRTDKIPLPSIPNPIDPYQIAFLRGGTNEVARSIVFGLIQKGFIEIQTVGGSAQINRINPQMPLTNLPPIEHLTLNWVGQSRESREIFSSAGLTKQLESYGRNYQTQFEREQMLANDQTRRSFGLLKWAAYLAIFGLGAYKIIAAVLHGHYNIFLLVIFIIVGLMITKGVAKFPRMTKFGKSYLERLQLAFDNLKKQAQTAYIPSNEPKAVPQMSFAGVDPLLLSVGVFGTGILAGTVFDSYNQAFYRAQASTLGSSSCSSGCGSCSTGSSGSSCSGASSCSSGSSCGGGCGGCGGGCS